MKLRELASRLDCELEGDGEVEIVRVAPIEHAEAGEITFLANPRYARFLKTTRASAVILARDAGAVSLPSLRSADPYRAFAGAVEQFYQPIAVEPGIHSTAVVAPSAQVGEKAAIGPYAVIGAHVRIGKDARIGPHVVIYPEVEIGDRFVAHAHVTVRERVRIGNDVILQSGVVIGGDGFGYIGGADGKIQRLVQSGNVVLEDGVEVGANATIDRAAVGSTFIRRSVKLDNLVMVAHGCEIGEGSMLAAQTGLSGSTKIGRYVRVGGQVGTAGHLTIGDTAQVAAQTGVANDIAAGAVVGGTPALDMALWRRVVVVWAKLPEIARRIRRLEKALGLKAADDQP